MPPHALLVPVIEKVKNQWNVDIWIHIPNCELFIKGEGKKKEKWKMIFQDIIPELEPGRVAENPSWGEEDTLW